MVEKTLVFIDAGFLSKLALYLGEGKYLKYDLFKLVETFAKKEKLEIEHIFYYTAPPFVSNTPKEDESRRKENYDKFISKLSLRKNMTIREGRVQRVKENGKFKFTQKGVDTHLTMDLSKAPYKFSKIKKIILIACDSDFVPVITDIDIEGVKTILYTYYDKRRNSNFSRSNELSQHVLKQVLITKEDFEKSSFSGK